LRLARGHPIRLNAGDDRGLGVGLGPSVASAGLPTGASAFQLRRLCRQSTGPSVAAGLSAEGWVCRRPTTGERSNGSVDHLPTSLAELLAANRLLANDYLANRLLTEWRTDDVSPRLDVSVSAGGVESVKSVGRLALRRAWRPRRRPAFNLLSERPFNLLSEQPKSGLASLREICSPTCHGPGRAVLFGSGESRMARSVRVCLAPCRLRVSLDLEPSLARGRS
jgi:hypothetical protein